MTEAPHVVIVGAGFGGFEVARHLSGTNTRVVMINRRNHHLIQPLLYQAATARSELMRWCPLSSGVV